ncbi:MAG: elongation factor P [Deltaproteobacteria bacterium]|nr:elongation factor P [Deltaproteobacteria bacterium]
MIQGVQLRAGMTIVYNGVPHKVMSTKHLTPGNKRGIMQSKLRNLNTGLSLEHRFRTDDKIERAILNSREMEFLYSEGSGDDSLYYFMDTESYEQSTIDGDLIGDGKFYLVPNVKFAVEFFGEKIVGATPPKTVELKIVDTPPNMKGATASSSYKPATLETGLVVGVPPFIESGEIIRVDSEEGKYIERARAE